MRYQVNAIFAVHSDKGLVFGSTLWVAAEEICFEVDAHILPTETIDWRMELTGLADTVMGTLKVERNKMPEDGSKPSRTDLPVYIARIVTMSDRDRELYRTWLEDRSGSKSAKHSTRNPPPKSKSASRPADKGTDNNVIASPQPKTDPGADPWMRTHGIESTSKSYGLNDRSSRQRSSLGRQAIRDALRAGLGGPQPKAEPATTSPRKGIDWLENAGRTRNPSFLDERPADRTARRGQPIDEDAGKGAPPEYDLPALDQANDTAHAMGFRARARPVDARPPARVVSPPTETNTPTLPAAAEKTPTERTPTERTPTERTPTERTPRPTPAPALAEKTPRPTPAPTAGDTTRADVTASRDLHVVHRAPGLTARTTRSTAKTEPPMDSSPSLDEFIRAPLPPPPAPPPRAAEPAAPDVPSAPRVVTVLPRSRPPQVTVHYRDSAFFHSDYEKHLRGDGIVIQLPDLDTTGMRAFIRIVLPSGKDVRCRAEVVTLMPEGAGVQLQLRPEDKELLRIEAEASRPT
jgi:hypothetical protein